MPAARFALSPSRIARFFYHECERNLRYLATPRVHRETDNVPPLPREESPVTEAVFEGGYRWEEGVITTHLKDRAHVGGGVGPLRERTLEVVPKNTPAVDVLLPLLPEAITEAFRALGLTRWVRLAGALGLSHALLGDKRPSR